MATRNSPAEERVLVQTYRLLDAIDEALDEAHGPDCHAGCVCEDLRMSYQVVDRLLKVTLESALRPFPAMHRRWAQEAATRGGLAVVS